MPLAQMKTELVIRLKKESTTLAEVIALIAAGAEVLAVCSYWDRDSSVFLLVSADPERTAHALATAGVHYQANSVLLIGPQDHPGIAARMGAAFAAAGIGVLYSYASWSENRQGFVVFKTTDDDRALRVATESFGAPGVERAEPHSVVVSRAA